MGTRFLVVATLAVTIISCNFNDIPESKVPEKVKSGFKAKYPGAAAKWEKDDGNYEASFSEGGKNKSVIVTASGTIIETETVLSKEEFPATALAYVQAHYEMKDLKAYAMIEKPGGIVEYECDMKGKDIMFDKDGNFEKEIKD